MQEHKHKANNIKKPDNITFLKATKNMDNQLLHEETTKSETYFCLSFLTYKQEY